MRISSAIAEVSNLACAEVSSRNPARVSGSSGGRCIGEAWRWIWAGTYTPSTPLKVLACCRGEGSLGCGWVDCEDPDVVSAEKRRTRPPQRPETEELRKVGEVAEGSVGVAAPDDCADPEPGLRETGGEWEL